MAKIFCCHSSTDKDIVRPVSKALIDDGHEIFLDEWSLLPGDSLVERIPEAISQSGIFIFFLSRASKASRWCGRELAVVVSQMLRSGRMRLFAVRLEAVDAPLVIDDLVYVDAVKHGYDGALHHIRQVVAGKLPATQALSYEDIEVSHIPVKPRAGQVPPAPHFAGIRISAKRFNHTRLYVRISASAPLADRYVHEVDGWPGGARTMITSFLHGHSLEHTEGPPGLEAGFPWVFVVFSTQAVQILDIEVREANPFADIVARKEQYEKTRAEP